MAFLDEAGGDVDDFMNRLYAAYLEQNPIDVHNLPALSKHIDRGIALSKEKHIQMLIVGDRLLQSVGTALQESLDNQTIDKKDETLLALVDKLAAEKYVISIPESDLEKLKRNVLAGNFDYVRERFYTRCVLDCQSGNCQNECKVAWGLIILLPLALLFFLRKRLGRMVYRLSSKQQTTDD